MPMIHVTFKSVYLTMWFTNRMLHRDGIGRLRRWGLLTLGWWWLVFGTILPLLPHYLRFYSRSFVAEAAVP
jgi:predicted metal-dependent hydrolase